MSFQEVRFHPAPGRVLAVVVVAVCALGIVALVWTDAASALRYGWALALIAALAWSLFWRPGLVIQEHGITVVNVFRTQFVPWPSILAIDTRFALTLHTVAGRVPVWAAPSPGRHRMFGLARKDFEGVGDSARGAHGGLRPSDALSTASGGLAQVIRRHWEDLSDAGAFSHGADPAAAIVTWHWTTIGVIAALTAATLIGLFV
ncbi:MAG: PH domain-containing protein [Microbacterium sp.]